MQYRFLVSIWCFLSRLNCRGTHLIKNWPLENQEWRIWWATTRKWCHITTSNWIFGISIGIWIEIFSFSLVWFEKFGCQGTQLDVNWPLQSKEWRIDWTTKLKWRDTTSNYIFAINLGIKIEVFSFNLVWFEMFGCHVSSSNCKLTISKQGMTNSPGSNGKITWGSSLKLRFTKRFWGCS